MPPPVGERRDRRGLGPFSGTHLTIIIVVLAAVLGFPFAAFAVTGNNVFVTDGEYPDQVVIGGGSGDVINHNVFANGARIRIGKVNVGASARETVTNNVMTGGFWFSESQSTSGFTLSNNLGNGLPGTANVSGTPKYAGGTAPTTRAGYALASGALVRVLPQWSGTDGIVHLVFASRRGMLPSVRAVIDFVAAALKSSAV